MSNIKVKICGITNRDDALAACDAGADALGFNFAAEARARNRYIEPDEARQIIEELPPFVSSVAVCVNESLERMHGFLEWIDFVQLHGEEPAEQCALLGRRAIKAFRLSPDFEADKVLDYAAAAYVVDAYVAGSRGGTGKTCDWEQAAALTKLSPRIILAGGLTPENVAEAIRAVGPYGVDTAGGVESEPGKKDHGRIREFIHNVRSSIS